MNICPNINLPEWQALEEAVGKFEAYKDFMETGGMIRTPEEVLSKEKDQAYFQLVREQESINQEQVAKVKTLTERIAKKFFGSNYRFENLPNERWKGKVVREGDKDVVVINTALATLDTPLHEFGHIFVAMIRKSNMSLYGRMRAEIRADKHKDLLAEITALYEPEGYTADEIEEEAIVELLGRFAKGRINDDTTYNFIQSVWEAIVKKIREIFGPAKSIVDAGYINAQTSIQDLADLLASDTKINIGSYLQKESATPFIEDMTQEINRIERLQTIASDYQFILDKDSQQFLIARKELIQKLIDFRGANTPHGMLGGSVANIMSYIDSPEFDSDLRQVGNFIYNSYATGQIRRDTEMWEAIKRTFPKMAIVANLSVEEEPYQGDLRYRFESLYRNVKNNHRNFNFNSNTVNAYKQEFQQSTIPTANRFKDYFKNLKDVYASERAAFMVDAIRGKYGWQDVLKFQKPSTQPGQPGKTYGFEGELEILQNTGLYQIAWTDGDQQRNIRSTSELLEKRKNLLKNNIQELRDNPSNVLSSAGRVVRKTDKSFIVKTPNYSSPTNEIVDETITVNTFTDGENYGRTINVAFMSSLFRYSDAFTIAKLPDQKLTYDIAYWERYIVGFKELNDRWGHVKDGKLELYEETDDHLIIISGSGERLYDIRSTLDRHYPGWTTTSVEREYTDGDGNRIVETSDAYKIPIQYRSKLYVATNIDGRVQAVMGEVMQGIQDLHYATENIAGMSFSPVDYTITSPRGKVARAFIYQNYGLRAFREDHMIELKNGSIVKYSELKKKFESFPEEELERRLKDFNYNWRTESRGTRGIRIKKYTFNEYLFEEANTNTIIIPESYRGSFMTPTANRPLYQLVREDSQEMLPKNPSFADLAEATQGRSKDTIATGDQLRNTKAIEVANKLSSALGVPYEMVSANDAYEITKNARNPWNGEPAFFYAGKIYFIADKLTTDLALHEFAHPLVRHLSKTDNKAFKTLYDQLASTDEGKSIIQDVLGKYADVDVNSDSFKEEVIVRALAADAMRKMDDVKPESKFNEFIKNLMYNIKQLLRKVFGKAIPVSKITSITKMDELSDILVKGDNFQIDTELISDDEFVAYNRDDYEGISDDLQKISHKEMQNTINTFYDMINNQLNMLLKNENYSELAEILTDEFQRGDLQQMRGNLSQWQTAVANLADNFREDVNESRNRVEALANTLFRLETVMEKVLEHVKDISQYPDTQDNMHKAYYYDKLVNYWSKFMDEFKDVVDKSDIPNRSPLTNLVEDTSRSLRKTKDLINEMYALGARDAVYAQMEPINKTLRERYEKIISDMEERGAPPERIDTIYKEYHGMTKAEFIQMNELLKKDKNQGLSIQERKALDKLLALSQKGLSISRDKIEAILRGNMGDANWFNSYLEGYLYNTDPVIGGLALYTKNALNDVMIVSQRKANTFAETMRPLLVAAGYNPMKIEELGEKLGFKDKVAKWNRETGELEEREVWTFLNKFKGYRYEEDRLAYEVDEAQKRYASTNDDNDKKVLIDAIAAQKKFQRDYMHQEFVSEFYDRYDLLEQDDIGKEASYRRERFFEELRKLTEPAKTETDRMFIADEIDDLWRQYRQMHSRYDLNGKLKTGTEAEIAKRLRDFKSKSNDFYEWKVRKGVFENAYLDFLQELRNEGVEEGEAQWITRVEEWKKRNSRKVIKEEWYNRRNDILDSIKDILKNLPKNERDEIDQAAIWEEIIELSTGYRDEDNQIIGTDISPGSLARIKELEQKLEKMRNAEVQKNGLTPVENERFFDLLRKKKDVGRLSQSEWTELRSYFDKKDTYGLSAEVMADLQGYYQELSEITQREATPYYVDILNNWLSKLDTSVMLSEFKVNSVTQANASTLLNEKVVSSLLGQDPEFDKWFEANHITRSYNKKVNNIMTTVTEYKRIYAWNIIKPSDPNMMESYDIKDSSGKVIDTIEGLPSLDYYARVVKSKYKTRKLINETVDNRGRFLPKTIEDGAVDSRYINEDYEKVKTQDPALFAVLEKMKEFHLKHQEGLSYKSRLYLDYPRFMKHGLEVIQSTKIDELGQKKWNALSQFIERIKNFLYGDKAQAEDGFNHEQEFNLVRADMFDNEITDIPISGLYDVDADDVSLNITTNMMRYMMSAERQKQLVKISPVVRAIQNTLNNPDNAINDLNKVNEAEFKNRGLLRYLKKPDNVRLAAVNNFIAREFEGQTQASAVANVPWLNNFANLLFKRASFSFFALNLPSALKNSLGMKFQAMIEASGGQFVDHVSLQQGNAWAYKAMAEVSFNGQLYKPGAKSHNIQLIEIFDPIQDRFADNIGDSMSRTMLKDAAEFSWLYSPRKWVEIQAALQLFGGIMHKKKIKQKVGGEEKEIKYIDAFETIDGQIRLKEGIDARYGTEPIVHFVKDGDTVQSIAAEYNIPEAEAEEVFRNANIDAKLELAKQIEEDRQDELNDVPDLSTIEDEFERLKVQDKILAINKKYDKKLEDKTTVKIDNSEFKYAKNQIQQVMNNMGGAYAKFDQPEAQRYLFFRFLSYLRRYFTTMAINRWGFSGPIWDPKPRLNPGLGDVQMGFYVQFTKTMIESIKQGGQNLKYLTDAEKTAMLKMLAEVAMLLGTTMLMSLLFGWDPDDDERYDKLREKSGALPFPLTTEDGDREFDMLGYMEVHALHMLMQVRGENEQFNLLTGGVKHYNSLLDLKSVAFGPTTDSYVQLWEDIKATATDDPSAYYTRNVGPYDWQQKGGSKFLAHFAKTVGLTGSSLDPAMAIQNFQTYQAKVR